MISQLHTHTHNQFIRNHYFFFLFIKTKQVNFHRWAILYKQALNFLTSLQKKKKKKKKKTHTTNLKKINMCTIRKRKIIWLTLHTHFPIKTVVFLKRSKWCLSRINHCRMIFSNVQNKQKDLYITRKHTHTIYIYTYTHTHTPTPKYKWI